MIARLRGEIVSQGIDELIVDVNGVGYHVHVPTGTPGRLQPDDTGMVSLVIHTSVREDAIQLYGFADDQQKHVFNKLMSISGIGPRLALSVLSDMSIRDIVSAVKREEAAPFKNVSGIGKKTASRLLLELKNAFDDMPSLAEFEPAVMKYGTIVDDLRSALVNLGHKPSVVDDTIGEMDAMLEEEDDLEILVREALKRLA